MMLDAMSSKEGTVSMIRDLVVGRSPPIGGRTG
jgi:hypothetical protein